MEETKQETPCMVVEAYVSNGTAFRLKELDFNLYCYKTFKVRPQIDPTPENGLVAPIPEEYYVILSDYKTCNSMLQPKEVAVPTQQVAIAWIEEMLGIHISILWSVEDKSYFYAVSYDKDVPVEEFIFGGSDRIDATEAAINCALDFAVKYNITPFMNVKKINYQDIVF